jgi:hypothetical protein
MLPKKWGMVTYGHGMYPKIFRPPLQRIKRCRGGRGTEDNAANSLNQGSGAPVKREAALA